VGKCEDKIATGIIQAKPGDCTALRMGTYQPEDELEDAQYETDCYLDWCRDGRYTVAAVDMCHMFDSPLTKTNRFTIKMQAADCSAMGGISIPGPPGQWPSCQLDFCVDDGPPIIVSMFGQPTIADPWHGTCAEFCVNQGLACAAAYSGSGCEATVDLGCDTLSARVCECIQPPQWVPIHLQEERVDLPDARGVWAPWTTVLPCVKTWEEREAEEQENRRAAARARVPRWSFRFRPRETRGGYYSGKMLVAI
jgi:hypothetical protein